MRIQALVFGVIAASFAYSAPRSALAEKAKLFVTSPLPIVLGEVETVSIVIEAPETPETEGRPIQVAVNVGRIDPPEQVGRGKYRAHYHLPTTKFPQAAIVAVWRETGPDAQVDFLRIPLSARTKLPYKTKPGAEVRVFIDSEKYGPVSADRKGVATIPIIVPPGVKEVDVEAVAGLDRQKQAVTVKVPPYNRLALAVTPYMVGTAIGADKPFGVAHVYYDDQAPLAANKVKLNVSGGEAKLMTSASNRFTYRITPTNAQKEIKLSASVDGDAPANATATILVGSPIAERILSRTSSTSMAANGTSTKVIRVLAIDHYGLGVPNMNLTATANAGVVSAPRALGAGYFEVTLTAPDKMPKNRKAVVTLSGSSSGGTPVSLDVTTPLVSGGSGEAIAEVETETARPSAPRKVSLLSIGAFVGGSYDAQFGPYAGVEIGLHPNVLDRRLTVFTSIGFRTMSKTFDISGFPGLKSSVNRLPVVAGLTYDLYAEGNGRGYAGLAFGLAGIAHKVEASIQDPIVYRRIVPTLDARAGVEFFGAFVEVSGIYMSISDSALTVPSIGFGAALGYRLGLF